MARSANPAAPGNRARGRSAAVSVDDLRAFGRGVGDGEVGAPGAVRLPLRPGDARRARRARLPRQFASDVDRHTRLAPPFASTTSEVGLPRTPPRVARSAPAPGAPHPAPVRSSRSRTGRTRRARGCAARRWLRRHRDGRQSMYLSPAFSSGSRNLATCHPRTPAASFARLSPSLASRALGIDHLARIGRVDDHHAVVVSHDHVAGLTILPAHHRDVHQASVALMVPLALMARLHTGSPSRSGVFRRGTAGVDDEPGAARPGTRWPAGRQEEAVVLGMTGRDDDVARPDLLCHHVQHPVVARVQQHRHRRAGDLRAGMRPGACRDSASGRCGPALRARWPRRAADSSAAASARTMCD